jgi:dienelactone hydrolase
VFAAGKDYIATPAIQGPLWQSFIANGRLVEWHFFSDANHGFRHPDNDGFQPHYADLAWPLVTDFLQRTV